MKLPEGTKKSLEIPVIIPKNNTSPAEKVHCLYCDREYAPSTIKNHELKCPLNPANVQTNESYDSLQKQMASMNHKIADQELKIQELLKERIEGVIELPEEYKTILQDMYKSHVSKWKGKSNTQINMAELIKKKFNL